MDFDYGSLLSPDPIKLSIGMLRKPTLREISRITFPKFGIYQIFLKITPGEYFMKLGGEDGTEFWKSLTQGEQNEMTMYTVIVNEPSVQDVYAEIFNFFFEEYVVFKDNCFYLLNSGGFDDDSDMEITPEKISGIIHKDTFDEVLEAIQQVCYLKLPDSSNIDDSQFKNNKAKRLWERMQKAQKKKEKEIAEKNSKNLTIPNIISSVSAKSNSLSILNIWDITIFQLYDQFGKLQTDDAHAINSMRIATWGDEKKTFDAALWYKNMYEKD